MASPVRQYLDRMRQQGRQPMQAVAFGTQQQQPQSIGFVPPPQVPQPQPQPQQPLPGGVGMLPRKPQPQDYRNVPPQFVAFSGGGGAAPQSIPTGTAYNAYEQALSGGPAFGSVGQGAQAGRHLQQRNQAALGGMSGSPGADAARNRAQQILSQPSGGYRVTQGPAYQDPNSPDPSQARMQPRQSLTRPPVSYDAFRLGPSGARQQGPTQNPMGGGWQSLPEQPQISSGGTAAVQQRVGSPYRRRMQRGGGLPSGYRNLPAAFGGLPITGAPVWSLPPGLGLVGSSVQSDRFDRYASGNPFAGPYGLTGFGGLPAVGKGRYAEDRAASSAAAQGARQNALAAQRANPNIGALPGYDRFGFRQGENPTAPHGQPQGQQGTPQQQADDLGQQLQAAEEAANEANRARALEIKGGYDEMGRRLNRAYQNRLQGVTSGLAESGGRIEQGFRDRESAVMGDVEQFGQSQRQRIADDFTRANARTEQDLISRGLGNTTVRESAMRGNEEARRRSELELEDALSNRRAQYRMGLTGDTLDYARQLQGLSAGYGSQLEGDRLQALERAMGGRLDFMERIDEQGPNAALYLELLRRYGQSGVMGPMGQSGFSYV